MHAPDPHLTDAERTAVIRLLTDARAALLGAVEPLSDAQWSFKPEPDRWSIGEIVEHLGLVERGLFRRVERALDKPADPEWDASIDRKTEMIAQTLGDRVARREAPAPVIPTGTVGRDEALRIYTTRREESLAFATTTREPLKAHTDDHHRPAIGTLNAYQWLMYIPLHNLRHVKQIEEITRSPAFPAS